MSELRRRFVEALQIAEDIIFQKIPSCLLRSAPLYMEKKQLNSIHYWPDLSTDDSAKLQPSHTLAPLFATEEKSSQFLEQRHGQSSVEEKNFASHTGAAFLGIDAGSTATKVVLIDEVGRILLLFFMAAMKGGHYATTMRVLQEMYQQMPPAVCHWESCGHRIWRTVDQNALKIDIGEVETMAHYKSRRTFPTGGRFLF